MTIRPAQPTDAAAIATIRERAIREIVAPTRQYSPEQIGPWASNFGPDRVLGMIAQGNYLVAEIDGRVVGIGRLFIESPGVAVIRGVFVDPDFVGRGIGTEIVKRLLALAPDLGIERFELVATLNARSFYQRLGFECLGRVHHTTANGAAIDGWNMRLIVPTPAR